MLSLLQCKFPLYRYFLILNVCDLVLVACCRKGRKISRYPRERKSSWVSPDIFFVLYSNCDDNPITHLSSTILYEWREWEIWIVILHVSSAWAYCDKKTKNNRQSQFPWSRQSRGRLDNSGDNMQILIEIKLLATTSTQSEVFARFSRFLTSHSLFFCSVYPFYCFPLCCCCKNSRRRSMQSVHDRWNTIAKSAIDLFTDFYHSVCSFCQFIFPFFYACPRCCLRHPESITESSNWNVFPVNSQNNLSHIAKLTSRFILFFAEFYLVVVVVVAPLLYTECGVALGRKAEKTILRPKKKNSSCIGIDASHSPDVITLTIFHFLTEKKR